MNLLQKHLNEFIYFWFVFIFIIYHMIKLVFFISMAIFSTISLELYCKLVFINRNREAFFVELCQNQQYEIASNYLAKHTWIRISWVYPITPNRLIHKFQRRPRIQCSNFAKIRKQLEPVYLSKRKIAVWSIIINKGHP